MVNGLIIYPFIMSDLVPDVLATLVKLSEPDRPSGIQAEVLRAVQNMVVLLDEQFLVHSAVHCVGDDIQEQLDGRNKVMGAAKGAVRSQPSEYEEDRESIQSLKCQLTDLSCNSGQLTVYPLQPYTNIPGVAYDIFP
jgi:hypothetical protein